VKQERDRRRGTVRDQVSGLGFPSGRSSSRKTGKTLLIGGNEKNRGGKVSHPQGEERRNASIRIKLVESLSLKDRFAHHEEMRKEIDVGVPDEGRRPRGKEKETHWSIY